MEKNRPCIILEQPGTRYYCACGKSGTQPHCDGSHKGSGLHPWKVEIETEKKVAICTCGISKKLPFCDGAHQTLG